MESKIRWQAIGVALIIFAVINLASNLPVITNSPVSDSRSAFVGESVHEDEVLEIVGSINRITGIPTVVVSFGMLIAGGGLLMTRQWAIMASLIALAVDIVLKIINMAMETIVGTPLLALVLIGTLIVLEAIVFFFLKWRC